MLDTSSSAGICCPDHISTLIQDATAVFSCIDSLDARIGPSTDMLNVHRQMFALVAQQHHDDRFYAARSSWYAE